MPKKRATNGWRSVIESDVKAQRATTETIGVFLRLELGKVLAEPLPDGMTNLLSGLQSRRPQMSEAKKLMREIESLRETIRREWFNIRLDSLTHADRVVVREHIERCHADLKILLDRLWDLDDEKSG